jgi:hypothetical protein
MNGLVWGRVSQGSQAAGRRPVVCCHESSGMEVMTSLLSVSNLKQHFKMGGGFLRKQYTVYAVDGISFDLRQTLAWWGSRDAASPPGAFVAQAVRAERRLHHLRGA